MVVPWHVNYYCLLDSCLYLINMCVFVSYLCMFMVTSDSSSCLHYLVYKLSFSFAQVLMLSLIDISLDLHLYFFFVLCLKIWTARRPWRCAGLDMTDCSSLKSCSEGASSHLQACFLEFMFTQSVEEDLENMITLEAEQICYNAGELAGESWERSHDIALPRVGMGIRYRMKV